jgi:hypothetical protein
MSVHDQLELAFTFHWNTQSSFKRSWQYVPASGPVPVRTRLLLPDASALGGLIVNVPVTV